MDKYEFNIKVEQIKKMAGRGDYATAMKIADTIDWHRVRNASLLSMIAQIYEKNKEYKEAKDILLLAFERAPIGKRLLYKLTDLALKEGSIAEAEAYYREFCDLAQDDPRQYLLRYLILKAKDAPVDQLIRALETYTGTEVDEKWLYELAELYHTAGMESECVHTCDRIMLLFGLGKYVDKAMDLKLKYAPLNKYQMDLVENRDKYEAKLRAVEEEYSKNLPEQEDYDETEQAKTETGAEENDVEKEIVMKLHEDAASRKLAREISKLSEEEPHTAEVEEDREDLDATRTLDDLQSIRNLRPIQSEAAEPEIPEEELQARQEREREIERQREAIRAAKEREEMEEEALRRAEKERELARQEEEERRIRKQAEIDRERAQQREVNRIAAPEEEDFPELDEKQLPNNLMIEADTDEAGLALALDSLKKLHQELGSRNPVAKISSEKLNQIGISAIAGKLEGKDLVIERAASLTDAVQNELDELMETDRSGMIVVLIDTPKNLEYMHGRNTALASRFQYIGIGSVSQEVSEEAVEEALKRETEAQERAARNAQAETENGETKEEASAPVQETSEASEEEEVIPEEEEEILPAKPGKRRGLFGRRREKEPREYPEEEPAPQEEAPVHPGPVSTPAPAPVTAAEEDDDAEMDPDEFAQYACKYAADIDCCIEGKSLLALYERIEMMEEDDVPLTKKNAVDLIEEAADKAENPSLGKKLTGLFSAKYNKDGYLILHENNFFD